MTGNQTATSVSYGHKPLVRPKIGERGPSFVQEWDEVAQDLTLADVVDAVGPLYVMDPAIRALSLGNSPVVGRALTVKAWPNDNLAIHAALAWAEPSDIVVVDWRGYTGACGGGAHVVAEAARRGLRGLVIDGAWRDIRELESLGFALFGRGESSFSPEKLHAGEIGVPIHCGGVVVQPGDVVFLDRAGVAVIPSSHASDVLEGLSAAGAATRSTVDKRLSVYWNAFHREGGQNGGAEERGWPLR